MAMFGYADSWKRTAVIALVLAGALSACDSGHTFVASGSPSGGAGGTGGAGGITLTGACAVGGGTTGGVGGATSGPITGVIHWADKADAVNVSIDDGGVVRGSVFGCDFCRIFAAKWEAVDDTLVLTPPVGQATMEWTNDVGVQEAVTEVHLARGNGSEILVEVLTESKTLTQTWMVGRVCKYCCGQNGPTGHHPCEGPLPPEGCTYE